MRPGGREGEVASYDEASVIRRCGEHGETERGGAAIGAWGRSMWLGEVELRRGRQISPARPPARPPVPSPSAFVSSLEMATTCFCATRAACRSGPAASPASPEWNVVCMVSLELGSYAAMFLLLLHSGVAAARLTSRPSTASQSSCALSQGNLHIAKLNIKDERTWPATRDMDGALCLAPSLLDNGGCLRGLPS